MYNKAGLDSWFSSLGKYPVQALVVAGALLAACALYVFFAPRTYQATGGLLVTGAVQRQPVPALLQSSAPLSASVASQEDLLLSEAVLQTAAERLGWQGPLISLKRRIHLENKLTSSYIKVIADGPSPDEARQLCDAVLDAYEVHVKQLWRQYALLDKDYWHQRIAEAERELTSAEEALAAFQRKHRLFDPGTRADSLDTARDDLERQLQALRVAYARDASKLAVLKRQLHRQPELITAARRTQANPVFAQLESKLATAQVELAEAEARYTERHPKVEALRQKVAALQAQLDHCTSTSLAYEDQALSPLHQQLLGDYLALSAQLTATKHAQYSVKSQLAALSSQVAALPQLELEYRRLRRQVDFKAQVLKEVVKAFEDAKTAATKVSSAGWVVQRAQADKQPVSPKPALVIAVGLVLLVSVVPLATSLVDALDSSLRTLADLAQLLGTLPLAEADLEASSASIVVQGLVAAAQRNTTKGPLLVCCLGGRFGERLQHLLQRGDSTETPSLVLVEQPLADSALVPALATAGGALLFLKKAKASSHELVALLELLAAAKVPMQAACLVS